MKVFQIYRRVLLMAALFGSPLAFAAGELVPMTPVTTVLIPQGDSVWNPQLTRVYNLNPLRLHYNPARSCLASPAAAIQVHFQGDASWYATSFEQNGYFRHKGGTIDGVRVNFRQYQYPQMSCAMQILGVSLDQPSPQPPPPPPSTEEPRYVGVISYAGGYLNRALVSFPQPINAQRFEIKVPEFCKSVEIVEAGTVPTSEHFIAARGVQTETDRIYTFDAPLALNNLVVSINGPKDLSCDIPLYILAKP